jgi:hypothetical protein
MNEQTGQLKLTSGTGDIPTYDEMVEYSKELDQYVAPKGSTVFGFWMQTIADLQLLDLELRGLAKGYKINPIDRTAEFDGDAQLVRSRIAHLEKVNGQTTLYTDFVDSYGDTNAYAFHNLYPYKGKFYPRVVRTLINAFELTEESLILDPFNGSGTTTHEASLMGIKSVGIDVTPMGVTLSNLKNELPFLNLEDEGFTNKDLAEIMQSIEKKHWKHSSEIIRNLMLVLFIDTADAFERTSRYDKKGKTGLFVEKYNYVKRCYQKLVEIKERYNLNFSKAKILNGDVLDLKKHTEFESKFDAIITSPPYYFSIDYVGKDKIYYDYLDVDMKSVESKYLGMKNTDSARKKAGELPPRVTHYYRDLQSSINNMCWTLKQGGKMGIVIGDSTVSGVKIPTTMMTKKFCEDAGFRFKKLIFNPLLGARNRAIRGESIILCEKP